MAAHHYNKRGLSVQEVLALLEESDIEDLETANSLDLCFAPPNVRDDTDEDSADEDFGGDINNLNCHQLTEECEAIVRKANDDKIIGSCDTEPENQGTDTQKLTTVAEVPVRNTNEDKTVGSSKTEQLHQQNYRILHKQRTKTIGRRCLASELPERNQMKKKMTEFGYLFHGPNHVQRPLTPLDIFEWFFSDDFIADIVKQSVLYAVQKGRMNFELSVAELKVFFGILLVSGYDVLPRKRMYWEESDDTRNYAICGSMRRNQFEDIMRNVHLNDNTKLDKDDRLSKIRPYLDHLRNCFLEYVVWEKESSVDEAMIPYFGRHGLKQFIRGKPICFGYKVWCHNFRLGYLVNFEVYQGSKAPQNKYKEDFGLGGGILLQFSESLPKDGCGEILPHHLFADNYFMSLKIVDKLTEIGIGVKWNN